MTDPGLRSDVAAVVARVASEIAGSGDPLERAAACTELIEELQRSVAAFAQIRDEAVMAVVTGPSGLSHRELARRLGISGQRVDQLARLAREGRTTES